jgi:hypothetical protein
MSAPFFAEGSDSEGSDDAPGPVGPPASGIDLGSSSDDDSPRAAVPGASTISLPEPAAPRRAARCVQRTPAPALAIEPAASDSEVAARASLRAPAGFAVALVAPPDAAELGRALLQRYGVVDLLQRLS